MQFVFLTLFHFSNRLSFLSTSSYKLQWVGLLDWRKCHFTCWRKQYVDKVLSFIVGKRLKECSPPDDHGDLIRRVFSRNRKFLSPKSVHFCNNLKVFFLHECGFWTFCTLRILHFKVIIAFSEPDANVYLGCYWLSFLFFSFAIQQLNENRIIWL